MSLPTEPLKQLLASARLCRLRAGYARTVAKDLLCPHCFDILSNMTFLRTRSLDKASTKAYSSILLSHNAAILVRQVCSHATLFFPESV